MTDKNTNNKLISKLFLAREQFILIGLTGRTGSGCTTAANILENASPEFPESSFIRYKSENYFKNLDSKRYEILRNYATANWNSFFSIKVSDLISGYLLNLEAEEVVSFIAHYTPENKEIPIEKISQIVKTGSFGKNLLTKSHVSKSGLRYKEYHDLILNHDKEINGQAIDSNAFVKYLRLIRKFTRDFKKDLISLETGLYVSVYQAAGNSIRKTGKVQFDYQSADFDPASVFHLPATINRVVKCLRKSQSKVFIVIDAIRNQHEARYFRDRYSAFYLISINAPEQDRNEYLQHVHKFNVDQLNAIDLKESGKTSDEHGYFISQNVKKCIEISDIHIFNPRNEIDNSNILKAQLAWYVALMLHPGLVPPTAMERTMQIAYSAKSNSGCISRKVGAVITNADNSVQAIGWNDVPQGQAPCVLRSIDGALNSFDEIDYSIYERTNSDFRQKLTEKKQALNNHKDDLDGRNCSYCFKDVKNSIDSKENQVHTRSLHAEENAFLQITKYGGVGISGGKLYTTASPCELCSKKAYQLGIKQVIFIDPYPGISKDHILGIGSNMPDLVQFRGAVGRGYHQLYDSTIDYKDELALLSES
ncbi:deoxycytidylate deaminase [Methylomonas sp. LL1]|uniref:anti-phage dCTP deaminase n=1 Tax=Methylomonas sp. LL1 TaxID=2785785 RepID=UPI0018C40010|nr:anti-phage dCTP deaminase [Methylomonas sp. LL1]QPK62906.1 deoxycytidylate deaminase [Methylomonas sp. LL1]